MADPQVEDEEQSVELVPVVILRSWHGYSPSEVAGFKADTAKELVSGKLPNGEKLKDGPIARAYDEAKDGPTKHGRLLTPAEKEKANNKAKAAKDADKAGKK